MSDFFREVALPIFKLAAFAAFVSLALSMSAFGWWKLWQALLQ